MKKRIRRYGVALGVILAWGPPAASQAKTKSCYDTAMTQGAMDECAESGFEQADAALNVTYRQVMARLKTDDESTRSVRQALVAAQKAWIGFRDAECAFQSSGSQGGSAYPMVGAQCEDGLTRQRTKELRAYLQCAEGDLSCPVPKR